MEFWQLTPGDFWFAYDTLVWVSAQEKGESANDYMTKDDYNKIMKFDKGMKSNGS